MWSQPPVSRHDFVSLVLSINDSIQDLEVMADRILKGDCEYLDMNDLCQSVDAHLIERLEAVKAKVLVGGRRQAKRSISLDTLLADDDRQTQSEQSRLNAKRRGRYTNSDKTLLDEDYAMEGE